MGKLDTSTRLSLETKIKTGRKVLLFYAITFASVEIIRHISNQ